MRDKAMKGGLKMPILQRPSPRRRALFWGVLMASMAALPLAASAAVLVPMTRLKLTVVQFVAASGDYKRWDALGGEFDIAADGTITIPSLGAISTEALTPDELAAEIAQRLQQKLGLIEKPEASVQVVQYPPIYVVGSVAAPGQFDYRPGISVIQALALAGGERRFESSTGASDAIRLEADLAGFGSDILRLKAQLARLKAEFARDSTINFPEALTTADPVTAEILEQERRIFDAHVNETARQKTGLVDLAALYNAEIDALGQKLDAVDDLTTKAEQQVASIRDLVAAGSATVSRLNDAERELSNLRSQRLDIVIATMTARENLNHSQRELAKLEDEQQSETARLLQQDQASLEKILQQQSAARRMLLESIEADNAPVLNEMLQTQVEYTILRQQDGETVALDATETSLLQPADLVKVTMEPPKTPADTATVTPQ
ncbi:polysaccharide biosynthesis/export family protein [Devosia sp. A369]